MKIEAGESLVYSWMRHIKKCQFVQTNWKASPKWSISGMDMLEALFNAIAEHFQQKHGLEVFKKSGFQQALQQLECDVIGLAYREQGSKLYAAEVAFHEGGLNYGSKEETVAKVISKLARIAFGLHCYLGASSGVVLFASPKINPAICEPLKQRIPELEKIFQSHGMEFAFRLVANDTFTSEILNPVLKVSGEVADTSELFLRCYQLSKMRTDAGTNDPGGDEGGRDSVPSGSGLTLPIEFIPADQGEFKRLLLAHGNATIHEYYSDGRVKDIPWRAEKMSETSNVIGNLRSRPDYRKGTWQRLGIKRLVVEAQ